MVLLAVGIRKAQCCFALAKPRAGVASDFVDEQNRLVTEPYPPASAFKYSVLLSPQVNS